MLSLKVKIGYSRLDIVTILSKVMDKKDKVFQFDVEKELSDQNVLQKKITEWDYRLKSLKKIMNAGVSHEEHESVNKLIKGYESLIHFCKTVFVLKK